MTCRAVSSILVVALFSLSAAGEARRSRLADASAADVGLDADRLARIDAVVAAAIKDGRTPGAVVLVVRQGKVALRKAYGQRQVQPHAESMSTDTVFDLASLTKPVATATAILLLVERGKLRLEDRVSTHLPAFGQHGKDRITIEHLLLHTSGLPAGNPVRDYDSGRARAIEKINDLRLLADPGKRFVYSDLGFIVLGELVGKVSGAPLDVFCERNIFIPLGLAEMTFRPGKDLAARAAPTEKEGGRWLRGEVHDPRARRLGGVAGHAGLFGTADDLAVYAQMLLDLGSWLGRRVLSPQSVRLMTEPRRVPGGLRALGWDVRTRYSSNRGERFDGFGHTGFTGTSLWIDPPSRTAIIVLTNRVHPDGKGNVVRLRSHVATTVADAITTPPFPERGPVRTGIDVLKREGFKRLAGRRVGLVTNHTGVDGDGVGTIDLLNMAPGVKLVALFSPEHGIRGEVDRLVPDSRDE
jgi:CubicO group peptidase (beta-lactamase class C family)